MPSLPERPHHYPEFGISHQSSSWKNYFSSAVVLGSAFYGIWVLVQKYIWPNLVWPTRAQTDREKENLEVFLKAETEQIHRISDSFTKFIQDFNEEFRLVHETIIPLERNLKEVHQKNELWQRELITLKKEVDGLCESLPKSVELFREQHSQALSDLSGEIKSLKGILLSHKRFPPAGNTYLSPTTITAHSSSQSNPVIPSWQLSTDTEISDTLNAETSPVREKLSCCPTNKTNVAVETNDTIANEQERTKIRVIVQSPDSLPSQN